MESRSVILLKKGYATGRLNFEYPNFSSRLREKHILEDIEKDILLEILSLKTVVEACLMSAFAAHSKQAYALPLKTLDHYSEIALPYVYKQDKIDQQPGIEDLAFWKDFHTKQKAALLASKANE